MAPFLRIELYPADNIVRHDLPSGHHRLPLSPCPSGFYLDIMASLLYTTSRQLPPARRRLQPPRLRCSSSPRFIWLRSTLYDAYIHLRHSRPTPSFNRLGFPTPPPTTPWWSPPTTLPCPSLHTYSFFSPPASRAARHIIVAAAPRCHAEFFNSSYHIAGAAAAPGQYHAAFSDRRVHI